MALQILLAGKDVLADETRIGEDLFGLFQFQPLVSPVANVIKLFTATSYDFSK
jgi:hypothetical protein